MPTVRHRTGNSWSATKARITLAATSSVWVKNGVRVSS